MVLLVWPRKSNSDGKPQHFCGRHSGFSALDSFNLCTSKVGPEDICYRVNIDENEVQNQ